MKRKSVREVIDNPHPNEYYVLVMRYVPMEIYRKGLKIDDVFDDWDRDLAPSKELLKDYKNGKITWEEYVKRFYEEKPNILIKRKLQILKEDAKDKEIVLVCFEEDREYPKCHTWLILDKESDFLTYREIDDVKASLNEIKEGQAKKFRNVDEFLKELKE